MQTRLVINCPTLASTSSKAARMNRVGRLQILGPLFLFVYPPTSGCATKSSLKLPSPLRRLDRRINSRCPGSAAARPVRSTYSSTARSVSHLHQHRYVSWSARQLAQELNNEARRRTWPSTFTPRPPDQRLQTPFGRQPKSGKV